MNRENVELTVAEIVADIEASGMKVLTTPEVAADLGLMPRRAKAKRLSRRRRAFAKAIAAGMSKRAAQIACGYRPNRKHANILMEDSRVRAEVERQRALAERKRCGQRDLFKGGRQ